MVLSRMVGARVRRKEDPRLITGSSQYVDDLQLGGMLYAAFVRSTYPHAIIKKIDPSPALAMPGVVAVITHKELGQWLKGSVQLGGGEGEGEAPAQQEGQAGPPQHELLAVDRVRYVGQPIAVVLATERYRAYDAAEAVQVEYEPLPAVVDPEEAMKDGAPQLHATLKNNIAMHTSHQHGDVEKAFAEADVVIKQRFYQQRLVSVPMEPRAVAAAPDPLTRGVTVWSSTQAPHNNRNTLAQALGLSHGQVRVIAPEVGGGFGAKIGAYPEDIILAAIALHTHRPVKWYETRSEHFIATNQGRGQVAYYELAATKEGRVLGLRLKVIQDLGGYPKVMLLAPLTAMMSVGVYDIPNVSIETYSVCTNKTPIGAYRGAGRPEAAYYIERMMDLLARRIGKDPAEVRRINYIPPDKFPYQTPAGAQYDSAEYEKALNKALEVSRYHEWRQKQQELRQQGRYIGIGLATYTEICGFGPYESASIRVEPTGAVIAYTGTSPHGQGLETALAQIIADEIGADFDQIVVLHGDTQSVPEGVGTMGSRSLAVGGGAMLLAAQKIREKAMRIAAHLLEAAVEDIEFADGKYRVKGAPDRAVTLAQIAQAAYSPGLPADIEPGLVVTDYYAPPGTLFPFGTHVAIVEVFPDTGEVKILEYYSVDDCGPRINPLLVEGQVHGGLAQGIAQALWEEVRYDENGQILTGTLMDYAIPKASMLPSFVTDETVTPSPLNPLGAKGIGEAATIGSTPTIVNAVMDALAPFGIEHIDMPLTPEKIWRAIQQAKQA
ncbi:MAG: xanthine dehydrogenase family protein molybdopterin-binding subunit [Thermomicrobium sp.]|nr:xanthine dehydrogenase family protein molybdopterin-binding subunit [Thermomicrobium sp.]